MICDICGKNPATIHLTEIINGQVKEVHMCAACAKQKESEGQMHFDVSDFLYNLINTAGVKKRTKRLVCKNCGMSYSEFKRKGRFGCKDCYSAFREELLPLLKKIHGAVRHKGKFPPFGEYKVISLREKIESLRKYLEKAVKLEEYEEAARIRDQIKELEKKLKHKQGQ